jgi:hypothetical protein
MIGPGAALSRRDPLDEGLEQGDHIIAHKPKARGGHVNASELLGNGHDAGRQ